MVGRLIMESNKKEYHKHYHCDVCSHNTFVKSGDKLTNYFVICLVHNRQECESCHAKETGTVKVVAPRGLVQDFNYARKVS